MPKHLLEWQPLVHPYHTESFAVLSLTYTAVQNETYRCDTVYQVNEVTMAMSCYFEYSIRIVEAVSSQPAFWSLDTDFILFYFRTHLLNPPSPIVNDTTAKVTSLWST